MKCEGSHCKGQNEATDALHPCPYDEDVHNDPTPTCTCCEICAHECAMDI